MSGKEIIPKDVLIRALYMILFFFVSYIVWFIILAVAIFQFFASLLMKGPDQRLENFGRGLGLYYNEMIRFLTYNTEQKPFPFDTWPGQKNNP